MSRLALPGPGLLHQFVAVKWALWPERNYLDVLSALQIFSKPRQGKKAAKVLEYRYTLLIKHDCFRILPHSLVAERNLNAGRALTLLVARLLRRELCVCVRVCLWLGHGVPVCVCVCARARKQPPTLCVSVRIYICILNIYVVCVCVRACVCVCVCVCVCTYVCKYVCMYVHMYVYARMYVK